MIHFQHSARWFATLLLVASFAGAEEPTATRVRSSQPAAPAQLSGAGVSKSNVAPDVQEKGRARRDVAVGADIGSTTVGSGQQRQEEMVVVGRATKIARRNLPNTVDTLRTEDIARCPVQTLEGVLQGRINGADIRSTLGFPGGRMQVKLRGVTTLNAHHEPLYVIDGVLFYGMGISHSAKNTFVLSN